MHKLPVSFYDRDDVQLIARELIGKILHSNTDGLYTAGIITETEAYEGITDKASHAYNNRRTARTEIMFGEPGISYIYLIYGMYSLMNVVTNKIDIPHAVLIRAVYPVAGLTTMHLRTNKSLKPARLCIGPGNLSKAMGFHFSMSGTPLNSDMIWISDSPYSYLTDKIKATPRIGVESAGDHALLPWRYVVDHNDSSINWPVTEL